VRSVQFAEAEEHFADIVSEAEAGESLTILRGDKAVAKIIPFREPSLAEDGSERLAATDRLTSVMQEGSDSGGSKITNPDEFNGGADSERKLRRRAAFERISAMMEKGIDLGGVWNGRSELYEGD
jgi:antitoxin (DNA-binding transcriptional repressor) of toxin-antitoxin stability system